MFHLLSYIVGTKFYYFSVNHSYTDIYSFIWMYMIYVEKAMAPHSSTLAWKIPRTEEPVRLQSMGSWRVRHDWATSLSLSTFMHWRRKWQLTPVLLPGESQGSQSLVDCCLWGRTELDTTEETQQQQQQHMIHLSFENIKAKCYFFKNNLRYQFQDGW